MDHFFWRRPGANSSEFLCNDEAGGPNLDEQALKELTKAWGNLRELRLKDPQCSRLLNALAFFRDAWVSYDMNQVAHNLATVLHILFSSKGRHGSAHEVAYNMSRFMRDYNCSEIDRSEDFVRFLDAVDELTYGTPGFYEGFEDITARVFNGVCELLGHILTDKHLVATFDTDALRRGYLAAFTHE